MYLKRIIAIAAGMAIAAGCGRNNGVTSPPPIAYCSAVRPIALSIAVKDSVTGRALADSASGTFQVDTIAGALVRADSVNLEGGSTVGTYSVSVQRPGYKSWTMFGISATQTNACGGVEPVKLTAALQRTGP